jgi:hypothetical protein
LQQAADTLESLQAPSSSPSKPSLHGCSSTGLSSCLIATRSTLTLTLNTGMPGCLFVGTRRHQCVVSHTHTHPHPPECVVHTQAHTHLVCQSPHCRQRVQLPPSHTQQPPAAAAALADAACCVPVAALLAAWAGMVQRFASGVCAMRPLGSCSAAAETAAMIGHTQGVCHTSASLHTPHTLPGCW